MKIRPFADSLLPPRVSCSIRGHNFASEQVFAQLADGEEDDLVAVRSLGWSLPRTGRRTEGVRVTGLDGLKYGLSVCRSD